MKRIAITLMFRPGKSHLDSVELRAKTMLEAGVISSMPILTSKDASMPNYGLLVIECKPEDYGAWIGFWQGVDFCRNNRPITVGTD